MTFNYYDGRVDKRYCVGTRCSGGYCYAIMVNDNYTTEEIYYDDIEYDTSRRIGEPHIDCPDNIAILVREIIVSGQDGWSAEKGDIVEVVKGTKFPIGMKMSVIDFESTNYKGHKMLYITFGSEKGIEKIAADNVKIIAIKGGSRNQEQYNDVHNVTYSDKIWKVVA